MVFFLVNSTNGKKTIEINTTNEPQKETAIATGHENIEVSKSNPVATCKNSKQITTLVPQLAGETIPKISKNKATVPEKNKKQTETEEKATNETTRKTIPGITQTVHSGAITQPAELQINGGIDMLNESLVANIMSNLENSVTINNEYILDTEIAHNISISQLHLENELKAAEHQNTNSRELNALAVPFCQSSKLNGVLSANNFPKNLNLVYANLQGMLEACHFDEFVNEISKTKKIHICAIVET